MNRQALKKVESAISKMVVRAPAYAALALNLKLTECDNSICPLMATDGVRLFYNPEGIKPWNDAECQGVIAHEAEHCGRGHMFRRKGRDMNKWNQACDEVINPSIKSDGFILPKGHLDNPAYHGMYEEEIYSKLPDPPKGGDGANGGQGQGQGDDNDKGKGPGQGQPQPGDMGGVMDAPGNAKEQRSLEKEWQRRVINAAKVAKSQGNIPGWMKTALDEFENPREDWRHLLSAFFTSKAKNDYSWAKPNRRYAGSGFILPGLESHSLGTVAVFLDSSGSTHQWWGKFADHLQSILNTCNPEKVIYMEVDAAVADYRELHAGETLPREIKGGGGTSFKPPFDRLEKEGIVPDCAVYLTDLYGDFPDDPGFPVLWAATSDVDVPFGDVIRLVED